MIRLYEKLKSAFCQVSLSRAQEETLAFNITGQAPFALAFQGEEEEASQQIGLSHQRTPSQPRARLQAQVNHQLLPHTLLTVGQFWMFIFWAFVTVRQAVCTDQGGHSAVAEKATSR